MGRPGAGGPDPSTDGWSPELGGLAGGPSCIGSCVGLRRGGFSSPCPALGSQRAEGQAWDQPGIKGEPRPQGAGKREGQSPAPLCRVGEELLPCEWAALGSAGSGAWFRLQQRPRAHRCEGAGSWGCLPWVPSPLALSEARPSPGPAGTVGILGARGDRRRRAGVRCAAFSWSPGHHSRKLEGSGLRRPGGGGALTKQIGLCPSHPGLGGGAAGRGMLLGGGWGTRRKDTMTVLPEARGALSCTTGLRDLP